MVTQALKGSGIPKIIHQIWIGANPRPDQWMQTVKDFAAGNNYQYMLWTEENLSDLPWDVATGLRPLYESFDKELAGKADIIRLLALYKHGGIYIDADSVILKPAKFATFLERNRAAAFFAWEEFSAEKRKKVGDLGKEVAGLKGLIANGTIGATTKNPFIGALLENIVDHATKEEAGESAWKRVGPLFVTRIWKRRGGAGVEIYPMHYFYPKDWHGIKDPELHKKVDIPGDSMLFQYGYSTNNFDKILKGGKRKKSRRSLSKRRRTRRRRL